MPSYVLTVARWNAYIEGGWSTGYMYTGIQEVQRTIFDHTSGWICATSYSEHTMCGIRTCIQAIAYSSYKYE
jgi:hypothetical protein